MRRQPGVMPAGNRGVSIGVVEEHEVFEEIGAGGFQRLVAAFYKQIPQDEILGPMYSASDLAAAEKRLRDFLIYRFGGPQQYIAERGHPRLRIRHAPFAVTGAARDHWLRLMTNALNEVSLPTEVDAILRAFFDSTANFLMNRASGPQAAV